jgi:hypothetical protein
MARPRWLSRAPLRWAEVAVSAADLRGDLGPLPALLAERFPPGAPYDVRVDASGIAVGRRGLYAGFGPLLGEAVWAFERYVEATRPARLTRVAVIYRNRLQIAAAAALRCFTEGARLVPGQAFQEALFRGDDTRATVDYHVAAAEGGALIVDLDLEVARAIEIPPASERVWRVAGELAAIEHALFFGSVTDEALEPYV